MFHWLENCGRSLFLFCLSLDSPDWCVCWFLCDLLTHLSDGCPLSYTLNNTEFQSNSSSGDLPSCSRSKGIHPSCCLSCCLLCFTWLPSADLGTHCPSPEMCSWAGWLVFVLTGVCWVCCLWGFRDMCCVCTNGCGGACEEGTSEELVNAVGVLCPQGSEL